MEKLYYKDTFVAIQNGIFRSRNHEDGQICWCCKNEFKDKDECILVFNNYKYIPNMIIHRRCFRQQASEMSMNRFLGLVEKDYIEYNKLKNIFG